MKTLKLIFDFFDDSKLSTIVLFFLITLSMLIFTITVGQYRYISYTRDLFEDSNLENSVYQMTYTDFNLDYNSTQSLISTIEKMDGVESVLYTKSIPVIYNNNGISILVADEDLINRFNLKQYKNNWNNSENNYSGIVGGYYFDGVKKNETIKVDIYDKDNQIHQFVINIIGKQNFPAYIPSFGGSGTDVYTNYFLQQADSIVIYQNDNIIDKLDDRFNYDIQTNFFVIFKKSISKDVYKKTLNKLAEYGTTATYDEILNNTDQSIQDTFKKTFPIPIFALAISLVCLLSISILYVFKKIKDYSIYYLCGCHWKKCFLYMGAGISLISIASVLVNSVIILNFKQLSKIFYFNNIILDQYSIIYILSYCFFSLMISILIPYFVFKKLSPLELYRRVN